MKKYLILLTIVFVSCTSFEYTNPLDKDSDAFQADLLLDDDGDGIKNYEEDDDGDGIKNYRDDDSDSKSDYFIEKEEEIVTGKESTVRSNDGTLDIQLNVDDKLYCKLYNPITFKVVYTSTADIIKVDFDFEGDGTFENSYKTEISNKSNTFKTNGIKTTVVKVVDENGNVVEKSINTLVYDIDSDNDSEKPIITLKGDSLAFVPAGEQYQDPGFTVDDDMYDDNELAEFVYVDADEAIRYAEEGSFSIFYTIYDPDGNKTVSERIVTYE